MLGSSGFLLLTCWQGSLGRCVLLQCILRFMLEGSWGVLLWLALLLCLLGCRVLLCWCLAWEPCGLQGASALIPLLDAAAAVLIWVACHLHASKLFASCLR